MKRILFAGYKLGLIKAIINYFDLHQDYEVRVDQWLNHNTHDKHESKKLLKWADIIVAEWCLGNAVWYAKHKKPHQKLFVRLHRYELYRKYLYQLDLDNVDKMIFIAPHIEHEVKQRLALPKEKSIVIFNTINSERFKLPKKEGHLFNIGLLGYFKKRKRPDRAFDILEKLKSVDERFTLYLKGHPPSLHNRDKEYFEVFFERINQSPYRDSIIFEAFDSEVHEWFRKIGFILSTSDHEGSHQAVTEGMASGSIPMITGWQGADLYYPQEFVKQNTDEIVDEILLYSSNPIKYQLMQKKAMQFSADKFDTDLIYRQWLKLVSDS